jgi:hypothetical protein
MFQVQSESQAAAALEKQNCALCGGEAPWDLECSFPRSCGRFNDEVLMPDLILIAEPAPSPPMHFIYGTA